MIGCGRVLQRVVRSGRVRLRVSGCSRVWKGVVGGDRARFESGWKCQGVVGRVMEWLGGSGSG